MQTTKGFTLVEVLVALLVLALALTAWQWRITSQVDSTTHLRDKVLAQVVADNQLRYLQLLARTQSGTASLEQSGSVQLAGQRWYWLASEPAFMQAEPKVGNTTLEQGFKLLSIAVSDSSMDAARDHPLATLTGVLNAQAQ